MTITILPKDYNPWVQALPSFLQNMALQKISQNFRGQIEKERRDIRKGERTEDRKYFVDDRGELRGYQKGVLKENRVYDEGVSKTRRIHELNKASGIAPAYKRDDGSIIGPENATGYFMQDGKLWAKTGKEPKTATTAMGAFLQKNPNASSKQITEYAQGLKSKTETPEQKLNSQMKLFKLKAKWKKANPDMLSINDQRIMEKDLTTMAITIESNPSGPGAKQASKFFNDFATGKAVYLWKTTKRTFLSDKQEAIRVDLPVYNGNQITARDVRATLAKNKGMTLEDFLRGVGAIE